MPKPSSLALDMTGKTEIFSNEHIRTVTGTECRCHRIIFVRAHWYLNVEGPLW
jgi:hypothetical protein